MSETDIERVADALEQSFKDSVAAKAAMAFEETGVQTSRVVWLRYAQAALDAIQAPSPILEQEKEKP